MSNYKEMPIAKALNAGLSQAMSANDKVLMFGEDVAELGGVFRVTEGLLDEFGDKRIFNTPIAESGIVGTAIGLAMRGYRPVVEIQFDGFVFPAFNQITTQLARLTYRSEGFLEMPVVIRIPYGGGIGAVEHHSESPEAYFAHTPGLRIVTPSNPNDAYWMMQQAIECPDPVIILEPKRRYWQKGPVNLDTPPLPLHSARLMREGTQVTLIAYGPMVTAALQAAEIGAEEGVSIEVIDIRSLSPIDYPTIMASVKKTSRAVIVHETPTNVSISSEIAARISNEAFYNLEAPVIRVGGFDTPYPPAKLEEIYLPDADRILEAIDRSLAY
ncbi:alpha-ketoacid dehydrogenase subunit beta [Aquiluna sp.]|nr:alpha-ketoacid dehydrogenase subunit beta [Aquiluna sp.]